VADWCDGVPPGWSRLVAGDVSASPAHREGFRRHLAATLPGHRWGTLAVTRDGELIGGAPVTIERRGGLEWLHVSPWLLPGTPLAVPGRHAEVDRAVAAGLAAQAGAIGAAGGEWVLYRPEGPDPDPGALASVGGETRHMTASVVDLDAGLETAWRRIERHARQELTAARRHGIVCAEEPGALETAHALYVSQARGWGAHRPLPIELARRLLEPGADSAREARLYTARDDRGILSAVLVLTGEHEWFAWWSGSHPDARRRHAFAALLWSVAGQAAATGARRFNVGASSGRAGVEAFKRTLGARPVPVLVRWLDARSAGLVGRVVAAVQGRLRRGRARGEES
jgi:Acetyltransferase (GNAT) domain